MKIKQAGFTLIELLVVIVILGILSTIGFANFKSYYGKAFDSERKAAIKNMATMVKVDSAAEIGADKYRYDGEAAGTETADSPPNLIGLFDKNDYKVPSIQSNKCYIYFYQEVGGSAGSQNEFAFVTPLEDGTFIADGTKTMVQILEDPAQTTTTEIDCTGATLPTITGAVAGETETLYLCTDTVQFADAVCADNF